MEELVNKWLAKQRELGEKGLEIKKFSNGHYVYRSTTYWDKELKKRGKNQLTLGLDINKGLIEVDRVISRKRVRSIWRWNCTT